MVFGHNHDWQKGLETNWVSAVETDFHLEEYLFNSLVLDQLGTIINSGSKPKF